MSCKPGFPSVIPMECVRDLLDQVLGRSPKDTAAVITKKIFWIGGCLVETFAPAADEVDTMSGATALELAEKIETAMADESQPSTNALGIPTWAIPILLRLLEALIREGFAKKS